MSGVKNQFSNTQIQFNENGQYRMGGKKKWTDGLIGPNGYCYIYIPKNKDGMGGFTTSFHRAMWQAFNGSIPEGHEIDHIDKNRSNNKLDNLRCLTINENRKHRDLNFMAGMRERKKEITKLIKSTNLNTGETKVFKNQSRTARYFNCSPALVYNICNGVGKTFGGAITFEYTTDPVNTDVPRKEHNKKYKTEEERVNARKEYYQKRKEMKKKQKDI